MTDHKQAAAEALKSTEDFTDEVASTLLDSWAETVTGIVLSAALPYLREQIAQEIEAHGWHNNARIMN